MNSHVCRVLSTICFQGGVLSIALSIWTWWFLGGAAGDDDAETRAHAERFGIFIGLWAPTLLILSNRFDRYADKAQRLPGQLTENQEGESK